MTLPCRKDYVVRRDEEVGRSRVQEGVAMAGDRAVLCGRRRRRMDDGGLEEADARCPEDMQCGAGYAGLVAFSLLPPPPPPPPPFPSPPLAAPSPPTCIDDLSPAHMMMMSPLVGDYFYSSNETSSVSSSCASPLSPLTPLSPLSLPPPLSPSLAFDAFPDSANDSDPLSSSDYAEDFLTPLAMRSSGESICMDDLSLSSDDATMEEEDEEEEGEEEEEDEEEGSFEDASSNDEMICSPYIIHTHDAAHDFNTHQAGEEDDAHSRSPNMNNMNCFSFSPSLLAQVKQEPPTEARHAHNPHKQAIMNSIRTHHLLPHFQQVVRFISEENFVPKVGEEELRVQQRRLLEVSSFPSFDDFLKTEAVGLVDDPEILHKIADMRRIYDIEVRKMDKYCNQFVDKLAYMLEDHNKIRTVTEQEMKAKAIIIHCKFQLLRCLLTKTISDQVRMLLEQREIQLIQKQLIQPAHIILQPQQQQQQQQHQQQQRQQLHQQLQQQQQQHSKNTYKVNPLLRAPSSSSLHKKDGHTHSNSSTGDKSGGRSSYLPTSFNRKTWKAEIGKAKGERGLAGVEEDKKMEIKQESPAPPAEVKKRRKKSLSKAATEVLNSWFNEHIHDPYPTEKEKRHLASSLGIHLSQVNNWFGNKRIRHKRKMAEVSDDFHYATQL